MKYNNIPQTVLDRINSYIEYGDESECWNWTKRTNGTGHPIASWEQTIDGKRISNTVSVQHLVLENKLGREIQTRYIDSVCNNPICCNPAHLQERDFENRFWNNVLEENGCWIWQGTVSTNGYGAITLDGENRPTHVLSYEQANGNIPDGLFVLHKCNRKLCINPEHLYVGTHNDNMKDLSDSGVLRGSGNGKSILTESDVLKIKELIASRMITYNNIAQQYGVKRQTIKDIALGRTWRWLE